MRKPSVGAVTAYGRLPFASGYVGNVSTDLQTAFARWLDEGIAIAMDKGGMPWREAFQRSEVQAFTFSAPARAKTNAILLGVLAPSEDVYGRPFPFCVVTEIRESAYTTTAGALPVAAERFIAEASEVCAVARTARSFPVVLAEAERRQAPSFREYAQAAQDLAEWSNQSGVLEKLWASLFPSEGSAGAARTLGALVETVVPMKSRAGVGTSRSVRLPLGRGGAAAAAFWIEVIRALAGWTRTVPSTFWPANIADGEVLICLDEVPSTAFAQLWTLRTADPLVVDARHGSVGDIEEHRTTFAEIRKLVATPEARVSDLFALLGRVDAKGG